MLISIDIINMKKFYFLPVFILAGVIFQFSSCDEKTYTVTIKNESSRHISYVYNGEEDSLGRNNSKQYIVGPYTLPPKNIKVIREHGGDFDNEIMTIRMENYKENIYTFVNIEDSEIFNLYVYNFLPIEIILRADKYIDDLNGSTEMKIPPNGIINGKIYTAMPNFTLFPSQYSVIWSFIDEGIAIDEVSTAIIVFISDID
jgi:hypothetical protein